MVTKEVMVEVVAGEEFANGIANSNPARRKRATDSRGTFIPAIAANTCDAVHTCLDSPC